MGVDHKAILIYGTTDNMWNKLPEKIQKVYSSNWVGADPELDGLYDEGMSDEAEEYLGKELYDDFKDVYLWACTMSDSAEEGFEGFGVELDPNNRTINMRLRKKVEDVFKKYNLGKPKTENFVHMY